MKNVEIYLITSLTFALASLATVCHIYLLLLSYNLHVFLSIYNINRALKCTLGWKTRLDTQIGGPPGSGPYLCI